MADIKNICNCSKCGKTLEDNEVCNCHKEETCGTPYTDLWVKLKFTLELSDYCKAIREDDSSPAFSSALCNKCIEKNCRFIDICAELYEMNEKDNENED